MYVSMKLWYTFVKHFSVICKILLKMIKNVSFFLKNIIALLLMLKKDNVKIRVGPYTFLAGYRISNAGYPVPPGYLANVRCPANYRICCRITGFSALKISRISVIRIVSISGIRPSQISGPTIVKMCNHCDLS